jgi:hypothetical protein
LGISGDEWIVLSNLPIASCDAAMFEVRGCF